jgi:hydrogenase maturation protease
MRAAILGPLTSSELPGTVRQRAEVADSVRAAVAAWRRALVIGYGNELRGDDAAGALVARRVASYGLAGTKVVVAPMLVPEMAVDMAESHRVLFVDASVRCADRRVRLSPVVGTSRRSVVSGLCSPETLAGLCEELTGHPPKAWLMEVPAERFDLGGALSVVTARGVEQATRLIRHWVGASTSGTADRSLSGRVNS